MLAQGPQSVEMFLDTKGHGKGVDFLLQQKDLKFLFSGSRLQSLP